MHLKKDKVTGSNFVDNRGTGNKKHTISEIDKNFVKEHIMSFPCVESHYCRSKTSKKYLDSNLNISKMYDLYKQKCAESNRSNVKESYYRMIFNTHFNLDFHVPKSDRCGKCEVNKSSGEKNKDYMEHIQLKEEMRKVKEADKKGDIPIICFDLENVLTCPKAEIGELFYLSKLNVYNLTAHVSTTKKVYCAIWNEYTGGRSGNDIASAFYKILKRVLEEHDFKKFITWSDSCVPQNKNSFMTYAIQMFIQNHPDIECIIMKYSVPGHSALQEVDNVHSQIEKILSKNEYFSPLGLLRVLKQINRKNPFTVIQMIPNDFKDFEKCSKMFNYKSLPFSKLKMLKFGTNPYTLQYSIDYDETNLTEVNLKPLEISRRKSREKYSLNPLIEPPMIKKMTKISEVKKKHISSMFLYMNPQDITFYETIFRSGKNLNMVCEILRI